MDAARTASKVTTTADRTARWRTTKEAAPFLGMSERVLRDTLAERARPLGDFTEARFDGIVGRKLTRRWKVWLSDKWLSPDAGRALVRGATMPPAENAGPGGEESHHGRA